jgi:hypothetical protein
MPELLRRIEGSRRRIRGRMLLAGAQRSLAAALVVFAALKLFSGFAGSAIWRLPESASDPTLLASFTLLALLAWSVVRAWLRTPDLEEVALWTDRATGLDERLTTAVETWREGPRNRTEEALLFDAGSRAAEVDPARLVPLRWPRPIWPLAVALTAALTLQLMPVPNAAVDVTRTETEEASESFDETGVKVRRVAELVAKGAEERNDPYLQAVARSLDQLGERIERGELARAQIDSELDRLFEHLGRALESDDASLSELLNSFSETDPNAAAVQETLEPAAAGELGVARATPEAAKADARSSAGPPPSLADILTELELRFEPPDAPTTTSATRDAGGATTQGFYTDIDPELIAELERRRQLSLQRAQQAGGQPVGAAEQANEGAGDVAGEGVQPLERGLDDTFGQGEEAPESVTVALPEGAQGEGPRIRREVVPEAELSEVEALAVSPEGHWRRAREAEGRRERLGIMDREVVSRYFLPMETSSREPNE